MRSLLEINDLNISFELFRGLSQVINHVNLRIEPREMVAIVGETGCGKTITIKAIMGILPSPPAKIVCKEINYKGKNIFGMKHTDLIKIRGSEISMVFQNPLTALCPVFTIGEQMMDVVKWHSKSGITVLEWGLRDKFDKEKKEEAKAKAINALKLAKMPEPEEILKKYPFELSGGMRQRVQIALALITEPNLIIFDEPTTALDVSIQSQIIELIKEIVSKRKISTLFITHNLGLAKALCHRIYVMYAGEIVEKGKRDAVFDNPQHPYTVGLFTSIPRLTGEMGDGIKGRIPDYINPLSGCRFQPRCEYAIGICKQRSPDFIEVEPEHFVSCHLLNKGV